VTVGLLIAPVPGAATVELQCGSTAALGQTVSAACAGGCRVEVAATAGTLLYTRRVFRDAGSEVVALSRKIAVAVR
jgi:hypothetical protein